MPLAVPVTFFILPLSSLYIFLGTRLFPAMPDYNYIIVNIGQTKKRTRQPFRHQSRRTGGLVRSQLCRITYSSKVALRVVVFPIFKRIVDQRESAAHAATELGLEAKDSDALWVALEPLGQLVLDLSLGHVGHAWVDHLNSLKRTDSARRLDLINFRGEGTLTTCFLPMMGLFKILRTYRVNVPSVICFNFYNNNNNLLNRSPALYIFLSGLATT